MITEKDIIEMKMKQYEMPIEVFSPEVDEKIDKLDKEFYLTYLILCAMVSPFFGWYIGIQDWFIEMVVNFF